MKKILFTVNFFLLIFCSFAQTDTIRTKGRKAIPSIIGKWQLDSINGSLKNGMMPYTVEFLANGEYNENAINIPKTGKWKIENGIIIRENRLNQLENLTIKKMVLSELEGKKKIFFYFSKMDYAAPKQDVIPH